MKLFYITTILSIMGLQASRQIPVAARTIKEDSATCVCLELPFDKNAQLMKTGADAILSQLDMAGPNKIVCLGKTLVEAAHFINSPTRARLQAKLNSKRVQTGVSSS